MQNNISIKIVCITCFITISSLNGQNPIDSVFNDDGTLKHVRLLQNERFNAHAIRFFKKTKNERERNKPLYDSLLLGDGSVFIRLNSIIKHINDNANIYVHREIRTKPQDLGFLGSYSYLFKNFSNLSVTIRYDNDTTPVLLIVDEFDPVRGSNTFKQSFFQGGIVTDTVNPILVGCGNLGMVALMFDNRNFISQISLYPKNSEEYIESYEFYDYLNCKKHTFFNKRDNTFEEYFYHLNSNLKKIIIYENNNGIRGRKKSEIQFDKDGNIIK